jgi:predicted RNase H-like nuclease (RuvC/YqgF family)
MRTPEDPCRDPASEARDDHASEPTTPETDALAPSQGRIRTMRDYIDELEAHARRLERQRDEAREHSANAEASLKMAINSANARQTEAEHAMRQRDELMEALERIARNPGDCDFETGFTSGHIARAAIAAVKGGNG